MEPLNVSETLLVDTDVLVEYLRGRQKAIDYLETLDEDLLISVISVAELFAGIRDRDEEQALGQFLLAFLTVPVTEPIAELAGSYRRQYGRTHGTGLADALIASTSVESGAELVTFNRRHFPMLEKVKVPYKR